MSMYSSKYPRETPWASAMHSSRGTCQAWSCDCACWCSTKAPRPAAQEPCWYGSRLCSNAACWGSPASSCSCLSSTAMRRKTRSRSSMCASWACQGPPSWCMPCSATTLISWAFSSTWLKFSETIAASPDCCSRAACSAWASWARRCLAVSHQDAASTSRTIAIRAMCTGCQLLAQPMHRRLSVEKLAVGLGGKADKGMGFNLLHAGLCECRVTA